MDRDSQPIPGFGFDPGYEPASHPVQAPPSSASIFGLISKVNKGILKSPQSNERAVSDTQAMQQAKSVSERFSPSETPSPAKQKAFQNAKSVIENIQRGIWNPPTSEQRRSNVNEPGFKVPLGMPKTKTASSTVGNTHGGSTGFRGSNKNQPSKQHVVAIPKSLVAYEDEDPKKKSSNFSRERALEEIDRYRGPSTNQRRDNKNEASRKTDKEPYKSDFDRYYYGDRSQRNELSDKFYGSAERKSNLCGKSNQDGGMGGKESNDGSPDYDYDGYTYTDSSNTDRSFRDYQYEEEKESFPSQDRNHADSMQDSSNKMNTGFSDLHFHNAGNQYAKSSGIDSQEVFDYGHTGQSFEHYTSSNHTNRSSSEQGTPYKNDTSSSSGLNKNQGRNYHYGNDNSRKRGNYDDQYTRSNDKFYRGVNCDNSRLHEVGDNVNKMETMTTHSVTKSHHTDELYENYLFGAEDSDKYEPSGNYNRNSQVEYVPTALRSREKNPSSVYSSGGAYIKTESHSGVINHNTSTGLTKRFGNRPLPDNTMAVTDDQKARVAGITEQGRDPTYKPVSAVTTLKGVPAPVPAPVSVPIPSGPIAPPGLYCKDCCITCPDQNIFDSHLKSDLHVLTLQKKAQELFHMETRQSRFDTDSSGNPLKVEVLPSGSVSTGASYNDERISAEKGRRSESPTRYRSRGDSGVQVIPPKPLGPLETRSVHDTMVTIQWRKRHDEEEKLIDKYVVEYRNAREIRWVRVGTTSKHDYEVNGLQEGTDYLFRVYTTNRNERSDYLESVLITTKKRRGFSPIRGRRRSSRERDHARRSSKETDHKASREREPRLNRDRQQRPNNDRERRSSRERPRRRSDDRDTAGSKDRARNRDSRDDKPNRGRKNDNKSDEDRAKETKDRRKDSEENLEKIEKDSDDKSKQTDEISPEPERSNSSESTVAVEENEAKIDNNSEGIECLLYAEFDSYEDEPMLGLDHIYEIRSYSATIPPRYVCKLCNNKGSHNIIVRHIIGFPHKLNYFKQYDPEVYDLINMIVVKKQQVERANYEARCVEDKIGRGAVRVMMMLNPHDNDGKIKYRDPILVKAPPPKRKKEIGEVPGQDDIMYKSMFDILYNDAVESGYLPDITLIGLSYVKEFIHPTQEKDSKFSCGMCSVMCSASTILNHIVGKRHRFNYLKTYHGDIHDQVYNARVNKNELLLEKIKELAEKDGTGSIKVKIARNDKLWKDKNERMDETSVQQEDDVEEFTEHVQEETMETAEEEVQPKMMAVPAIKFDIKKTDPLQTNINPTNVLELEKSQKGKEVFDWNKENGLLQLRIQNESIVKSSRTSKFITVYSEFFKRIPVIGMQWVTEFQRPDPKAEPWYMCFMCQQKLQWKSILDHVTSNLHRLNYMKKNEYRQKYNAVYNVIKSNKQEARPMIETFSKEILNIEGPPTDIQVMLELQVNTEAFKAVAKVQENVKAHASFVAVTTASAPGIQINIATTSLPQTLSSENINTNPPLSSTPAACEVQTSTVPPSHSWAGSGQPLIQGPSGVCPPVPPPLLPSVRMQGSTSAIPLQTVPMQTSVQTISYPPQNTYTSGFPNIRMPNVYAPPPVYPSQGVANLPVVANVGFNLGQAVPSSTVMAVPVRGLAPNVATPHPFQPIFQQTVPNVRPLVQPHVPVTQIAAPVSVYQPVIQGQAPAQIPPINEGTSVQNLSSSNSATMATTMHSTNTPVVRPPSIGTHPPWLRQQNQILPNQVGSRPMLNPRPLLSMPSPRMIPPPAFVSKQSEVNSLPVTSTNTYSAGNNNLPDKVRDNNLSNNNTAAKPVSSEQVPSYNHYNRNNSLTSAASSDQFTSRDIDHDNDGFTRRDIDNGNASRRGVKRLSEEREELDRVKKLRSDDRHSSSPRRDYSGRTSQENSSKLDRERDQGGRRNIQSRQDHERIRDNPRGGNNIDGRDHRENLRGQDNRNRRQARSPPRRRWSRSPPNLQQSRGSPPRNHHSRSPPLRRRRRSSRSPPLRRRYSRSPPSQLNSLSPPLRSERRLPYQPRGREEKYTRSSNNNVEQSSKEDMYKKEMGADRYFDHETGDRYGNNSAPLDKTEVDDLVRRYSDRVDDEYGFGADVDNDVGLHEMYEDHQRVKQYEDDRNYYATGYAPRGKFDGRSTRNDRSITESQYRSDRDMDFIDKPFNRHGEVNDFRRMESRDSDHGRMGRNFDSRRDEAFNDNCIDSGSYRDNNSHGQFMSDNHGNSYSADDRNSDRRFNDKNNEQKFRINRDSRFNSDHKRSDNSQRDNFQSAMYNQNPNEGSRLRDDRMTGYRANRDGYYGNIENDTADTFDDRMPDPPREEIEELLRRATNMVTPPPDEFEDFQVDDQMGNVGSRRNTDRMYGERSVGHYGNTSCGSYGDHGNRTRR